MVADLTPIPVLALHNSSLSLDEANRKISELILSGKPSLVARFSRAELEAVLRFHRVRHWKLGRKIGWTLANLEIATWKPSHYRKMKTYFTAITEDVISKFYDVTVSSAEEIDLMGSWVPGESQLSVLCKVPLLTGLAQLEPFFAEEPWTGSLAGKKVLVVHPFDETIRKQFAKREDLHKRDGLLPSFDLITVKPPWSIFQQSGLDRDSDYEWFGLLEDLIQKCSEIEFDVAIIGAGAYGLPLGAAIKKSGRTALVVGSSTQLLFGIRGARWEKRPEYAEIMTDFWSRPSPEETPAKAPQIENSAYW
jgi:hypothetical protein